MTTEAENYARFEIGQVLFIDLVGYSKLSIEDQKERLGLLTAIVLVTAEVRESTGSATIVKEGGAWKVEDESWAAPPPK